MQPLSNILLCIVSLHGVVTLDACLDKHPMLVYANQTLICIEKKC